MRIIGKRRFLKPATAMLVLAMLPTSACKKDAPTPEAPVVAADTSPAEPPRPATEETPGDLENGRPRAGLDTAPPSTTAPKGLFASETLALAPSDALAAFVFQAKHIAEGLGLGALLGPDAEGELRSIRESLLKGLESETLDADAFRKAGINPDTDVGLAVLSLDSDATIVSVALSDRAAFLKMFDAFAGRKGLVPATEALGDYTLVSMKDNTMGALLINATHATFFGCNYQGDAVALARAAAAAPKDARLVSSAAFAKATMSAEGTALGMYLSPSYISLITESGSGRETWLGLSSGVGLGVSLSATGATLVSSLPVNGDAPLARVLLPSKELAAQKMMGPDTLFGFGASVDPEWLLGFALSTAGADIEMGGEVKAAAREFMNIDLDKDVLAKLTGQLGLAIDAGADANATIRIDALKGAALIGVKDTAEVSAMLAALPASKAFEGSDAVWDAEANQIKVPTNIGPIVAKADAGAVVITNDTNFMASKADSAKAPDANEALKTALAGGKVAAFIVGRSLILQPIVGDLFAQRDIGLWAPPPEDDEADDATKKVLADLNEAYEAALTEHRAAIEANQNEQMALIRDAGLATMLLEKSADGIVLRWIQSLNPDVTLPALIKRALNFLNRASLPDEDSAVVKYNALRAAFQAGQYPGDE